MPPKKVYRARGLQLPLNVQQVCVILIHVVNMVVFYLAALSAFKEASLAYVVVYSVLNVSVVSCWFYTSMVDAAKDPTAMERCLCLRLYCFKRANLKKRYCAMTRKTVPGMDHYCKWMNTAIGERNYVGFFSVVSLSTVLFTIQIISGIGMLTFLNTTGEMVAGTELVLALLCIACGCPALMAYGTLLTFHLYLIKRQFGTYDFLIERAAKRREKKKGPAPANAKVAEVPLKNQSNAEEKPAADVEQGGEQNENASEDQS